jgi:DNA-binding NarL/FixJ family response regulator
MKRPKVLLAGDCSFLLAAFEKLLESEFEHVGTARNAQSLFSIASKRQPDIIVLDLSLPLAKNRKALQKITQRLPDTKLICLGSTTNWDQVQQALRGGASGYLLKTSEVDELSQAVQNVLKGQAYLTPLVTQDLANSLIHGQQKKDPPVPLTQRQEEVLALLVQGNTMREVATLLKVSPRTVAFHKYRMMSALKISSNAELIQYAVTHGLGSH